MPLRTTTWNLARRRWLSGSHHRSSAVHGPAQASMSSQAAPLIDRRDGELVRTDRLVTPTDTPSASTTSAVGGWLGTVAGAEGVFGLQRAWHATRGETGVLIGPFPVADLAATA